MSTNHSKTHSSYEALPGRMGSAVTNVLLAPTGGVAWISQGRGPGPVDETESIVLTALARQDDPAEVDRGTDIGATSLRRVPGDRSTFRYLRGRTTNTVAFGGPAASPAVASARSASGR